ncbi:LysR family transcriptional regulator [Alkalilacustris brevis]|uniref:LysR family transcriptional regulator n=1 Tax=Alkalilacustris brevis TaxID=2026338 RepID=UPI000E0D881C|nr:LysR family transcriptional regulator [Alkalilacustris brevis]
MPGQPSHSEALNDLPNLRHLRAFILTAEFRSVKRAAEAVHLSQPAVTQAIGKLEARFGVDFFYRCKTGMYLTNYGEAFCRRISRALREIDRACAESDDLMQDVAESTISRMVSTAQLRTIIAIADQGNFTLAARALGVSQPSVQRTARSLEHLLGSRLFSRSRLGVGLSPRGERFARGAKLAIREIELAFDDLEHMRDHKVGRISIGANPLARACIVPLAVTRLLNRYPDVHIRIIEGAYKDLIRGLWVGDLDVVVGALRSPPPLPDLDEQQLFTDSQSVVVRHGHPLTRLNRVTLSDTVGYPWIVPRPGTPTRAHFHSIFRDRALSEPKRLLEVSSHVSVCTLLSQSDRVTLLSNQQVQEEERLGRLHILPIELPETRRTIGITTRNDWEPSEPQVELIRELERVGRVSGDNAALHESSARRAALPSAHAPAARAG